AKELVFHLVLNIRRRLLNSYFPVLSPPIGLGCSFKGWPPCVGVPVYRSLVPLKPPHGYIFHLEPDTAGGNPARIFCIRVGLQCTCNTEQQVKGMPCFLHPPEEETMGEQAHRLFCIRRNQAHRDLQTLCIDSYLNVEKTVSWFDENVEAVRRVLPQASQCWLKILHSRHCCTYQLGRGRQIIVATQIIFGVQQLSSDISMSSQTSGNPPALSSKWIVTCAVAEAKFFKHMARLAPTKCVHLKCLQAFAHLLEGSSLSIYAFKTVVMHLLTTAGPSGWDTKDFVPRTVEIMQYMYRCLEDKCLNHFFLGNENMPCNIILPPEYQMAEPLNLFQHLRHDSNAHARAMHELRELRLWLER
ncbi:IPIL1 protein, partial [Ceuthmochares aereus]|nr:IPIL1 protein [Ceuthmochares aereus]